ncbi:MAG: hypothetical protein J0L64_06555 [Acidobacteria bacterium]|nr:hypothetical protein [Acidobacteriota bacterium]
MSSEIVAAMPALRLHLRELVESPAFKGSRRGQQFLEHIVEKALAGQGDELKERNLGVELFGRDPSYDTGQDAIVRVTASDVRKRLHQFYSETPSAVRIEIPSGSYTPHFSTLVGQESLPPAPAPTLSQNRWRRAVLAALLVVAAVISARLVWQRHRTPERLTPLQVLPWSALLQRDHQIQLVLADVDVSAIQNLTGSRISLSDYANRRYLSNPESFGGDMRRALSLLRGVNVAAVDVNIALAVSRLASGSPARLKLSPARSLQIGSFATDDDFIILGSPRSNPWNSLFEDQLDFDFVHDPETNREIIRNKRIQPGELPRYVPTAKGWDTGHAFAMISLVGNPNQAGMVLLVAGTSAESTEAAGQLVANTGEFARTLRNHGIDPSGPLRHFQFLLQVRTMAGSPSRVEVVACHRLPDATEPRSAR